MKTWISLNVFKIDKNATTPTRSNPQDAGLDLYALKDTFVPKGKTVKVPTGIAIQIPKGYVGKIEDRSSLAVKGLRTGAGVVDSGFSGEVCVVIHNLTNEEIFFGDKKGYLINKGDKVAQILTYTVATPKVNVVDSLWESDRGDKGFGSSGK